MYVAGVGQHQMWAAQFISYEKPRTWLNSGGLGTMGFAVPAAMGAKIARPDAEVWAIDGDGCFQMTNQELATCAIEGVPIKVALINNGNLGMVRQWQTLFYEERYWQTDLATHSHRIPDFVKLAEALGCVGLRCEREEDVVDVINQARAIKAIRKRTRRCAAKNVLLIHRIVMLTPPNQGSRRGSLWDESKWFGGLYRTVLGDSGKQVASDWQATAPSLATPRCEFGIIAGGRGDQRGWHEQLPGDDDGTVTVSETRLAGARGLPRRPRTAHVCRG